MHLFPNSNPNGFVRKFSDDIFYLLTSLVGNVSDVGLKKDPRKFCKLACQDGDYSFATYNQELVSIIEIGGAVKLKSSSETNRMIKMLHELFEVFYESGHTIDWFFEVDKAETERQIDEMLKLSYVALKDQGLENLSDIIDETKERNLEYCHSERCFISLTTDLSSFSKQDQSDLISKQNEKNSGKFPFAANGQFLGAAIDDLRLEHETQVDKLVTDLTAHGLYAKNIFANKTLREIRKGYAPGYTPEEWEPYLSDDQLPLSIQEEHKGDASNFVPPSIPDQLMPLSPLDVGNGILQVGDLFYAPVSVKRMPKKTKRFDALFERLKRAKIPWRMRVRTKGKGESLHSFHRQLAMVLHWTKGGSANEKLLAAYDQVEQRIKEGEIFLQTQMSFCTWGNSIEEVKRNRTKLVSQVSGWGVIDLEPAEGDLTESFLSSNIGIVNGSTAKPACWPLTDLLKMMPLTRPSSPYASGSQLLRSKDGKLLPNEMMSKMQASWIMLVSGSMGGGKTAYLVDLWFSVLAKAGNTEIPFMFALDVGPGMRGFIETIQDAVGEDRKHIAKYVRLKNSSEYCMNPHDTWPGMRFPLADQVTFMMNFWSLMATPSGGSIYDGVESAILTVIKNAFKKLSLPATSKKFYPTDSIIDEALEEEGFWADGEQKARLKNNRLSWFDVVDFLFTKGRDKEASIAHKMAVPTVDDLIDLAAEPDFKSSYNDITPGGMPVSKYVSRVFMDAKAAYPIIDGATTFDLSNSKIISLDLEEVLRASSGKGSKSGAIIMLLSLNACMSRINVHEDHLLSIPKEIPTSRFSFDYHAYHSKRVFEMKRIIKLLQLDEKHRFNGWDHVNDQLDQAGKEARKNDIFLIQSSQDGIDFSPFYKSNASSRVVLNVQSVKQAKEFGKEFGLSDVLVNELAHNIRPPNKAGAQFVGVINTEEGSFEQSLVNTRGPKFLWPINSKSSDRYIYRKIVDKLGSDNARALLAEVYPSATARSDIERRMELKGIASKEALEKLEETGEADQSIVDEISEDLHLLYQKQMDPFSAIR